MLLTLLPMIDHLSFDTKQSIKINLSQEKSYNLLSSLKNLKKTKNINECLGSKDLDELGIFISNQ